jgi:hypothetical protein
MEIDLVDYWSFAESAIEISFTNPLPDENFTIGYDISGVKFTI